MITEEKDWQVIKPVISNKQYRVGILGATGTVGQRFIQLLDNHPQFKVTALAASDRSQGEIYAKACTWRLPGTIPESVRSLRIEPPRAPLDCELVFSSLPASIALQAEDLLARAGYPVFSNSSAHRMESDVPLLIPEVNHEHLLSAVSKANIAGIRMGIYPGESELFSYRSVSCSGTPS